MRCPFCAHTETQVVDSRVSDEGDFIRRRRQCAHCGKRFTTYERPDVNYPTVVKKDGRRIEYEPAKLRGSLALALRKRPVSTEQVDGAIERIEEKLLNLGQREIASHRIGEMVMNGLRQIDSVAYIRFASVYRDFSEARDFEEFASQVRDVGGD